MSEDNKKRRMTMKAASAARKKNFFLVQFSITASNKKKKVGRHIRNYPEDLKAVAYYEKKLLGRADSLLRSPRSRARKRLAKKARGSQTQMRIPPQATL